MILIDFIKKIFFDSKTEELKTDKDLIYYKDGSSYVGKYRNGKRNGWGTMTFANGDVYTGEWVDDLRNGDGIFKGADGFTYEGEWDCDKREGKGILKHESGFFYEGNWYEDSRTGRGWQREVDESTYKGLFRDGKKYGEGIYTSPGGLIINGIWKEDLLVSEIYEDLSKFTVYIEDNWDRFSGDGRGSLAKYGDYNTLEEAILVCQDIVDKSIKSSFDSNKSWENIYKSFQRGGTTPFIKNSNVFSAEVYAEERAKVLCNFDGK